MRNRYVIDWMGNNQPIQLTKTGFYHSTTLDYKVSIECNLMIFILVVLFIQNFKYFVSVFSSGCSRLTVSIYLLNRPALSLSEWCAPSKNLL